MRMVSLLAAAATAAVLFLSVASQALAGVLIPIPLGQGWIAEETVVRGINDSNVIVGFFADDNGTHGFVGTLDGNYTTFDYGAGFDTFPQAISGSGYITGYAYNKSTFDQYPFVRSPDGVITNVTKNGKPIHGFDAEAEGVVGRGTFVGEYRSKKKERPIGFYGKGSRYQGKLDLMLPKAYGAHPYGLNKWGDVVGGYSTCDVCADRGFGMIGGYTIDFTYPIQYEYVTDLRGINSNEVMVGDYWQYIQGNVVGPFGFVLDRRHGLVKTLKSVDIAWGINRAGLVAASGRDDRPYIYCPHSVDKCPTGGGMAIEIDDHWIPARPDSVRSIVCSLARARSKPRALSYVAR
ncbi:MAG TPA: hypothetical protein VLV55_05080 [Rhizomicrobium sp.]|nr:hypothetical protein [Rhizomicrobium sp.]